MLQMLLHVRFREEQIAADTLVRRLSEVCCEGRALRPTHRDVLLQGRLVGEGRLTGETETGGGQVLRLCYSTDGHIVLSEEPSKNSVKL